MQRDIELDERLERGEDPWAEDEDGKGRGDGNRGP
jgi:hypothetical protein